MERERHAKLRATQNSIRFAGVILPDGWKCKRHLRCSGSLMGKAYTVYHSPEGYICRSKVAARERLGLPRQPAAAATSGKVRDKTADKNHSQQVSCLGQTRCKPNCTVLHGCTRKVACDACRHLSSPCQAGLQNLLHLLEDYFQT